MTRFTLIYIILVVFASWANAASSSEAVNFVEKTNHFLYEGEYAEIYPVARISHSRADYWVVSILSGGSIAGFVPVKDAKTAAQLQFASGKLARKQLIKTAHYLRLYDKLKSDFSRQGIWVLKNTDVEFFNALSNELKNERIDLTTIESELEGYYSLQARTDDLRGQLDEMYPLAKQISEEMNNFKETEARFFSTPDTNSLNDFVDELDAVFALIELFNSKKADYLADLDELKQGIAQTELSVESKRSLNALASVPLKMIEVSSRIMSALNLKEKTDEAYSSALNQSDNFVQNLAVREKRSSAWLMLHGFDSEIVEETRLQGIDSVSSLAELVLSEDYIYQWNEQGSIAKLQETLSKANAYYNGGAFDSAEQFAEESKEHALKIFKAGLKEQEQPINTDLLITGAVLLILAIIILYAIRNREKLSSLVSVESEEEVPIHEWEK